jgi:hypothetical protein
MLAKLTSASRSGITFASVIFLYYCLLPLGVYLYYLDAPQQLQLAGLSLLAAAGIYLGFRSGIGSRMFKVGPRMVSIGESTFLIVIWSAFVLFAFIAWATADRIPLIAALQGEDDQVLAILREEFLKTRSGWESVLVYVNALLTGSIVPFALAVMFYHHRPLRWACLLFFVFYCLSFLEKAFFFKALLPLVFLAVQGHVRLIAGRAGILTGAFLLLILITYLSGAGGAREAGDYGFFTLQFAPQSALEHIAWRSIVVPVLTAADALRVFDEWFNGEYFLGSTSTLLSGLFGMERVSFERIIFFAQWGQNETESGSSNSVYVTEAFVNFSYAGVLAFSAFIGIMLRAIAESDNEPLKSVWMLFCLGVFTAGMIGTLASNGFLLLFIFCAYFRLKPTVQAAPAPLIQARW